MIANIIKAGSAIPNVNFVVIDADKAESSLSGIHTEKLKQIVNELKSIFP